MTAGAPAISMTCTLCGARDARRLEQETRVARLPVSTQILECLGCRLRFLWPRPDSSRLAELYPGWEDAFRQAGYEYIGGEAAVPRHLQARLRHLQAILGRPGRLLDVGAGSGAFLQFASTEGWQATGSERSEPVAAALRRRLGLDIRVGDLTELAWPAATFDLIHMNHVLEHLVEPLENLRAARRMLRPGGLLALEVPWEFSDLAFLTRRLLGTLRPYPVPSEHLWFFGPATLRQVVAAGGFDIVSLEVRRDCRDPRPLRRIAKHALHQIERRLGRGPLISLVARRPLDQA